MRYELLITLIAVACVASSPSKADEAHDDMALMFGIGTGSCAHWLSTRSLENEGNAWLMGWWSAFNNFNESDHKVGKTTDMAGVIGEVRKVCVAEPSTRMTDAILVVWNRFIVQHR
jgi:hypothetical protein